MRSKIWLEREGNVALSEWRVGLLEAIDEPASLPAAAARLDVPYRTAWEKLREIERTLGTRLVASSSGGAEGGRTVLTAEGRDLVRRFRELSAGIQQLVEERFRGRFGAG